MEDAMKRYRITVDGSTLDVQILSDPRLEEVEVEVNGQRLVIQVERVAEEQSPLREDRESAASASLPSAPAVPAAAAPSNRSVTAPLPGVVKAVAARPGQQVVEGDRLLVIEAMKMDNIIRSPRAGTIDAVHVAEGHRVVHGQLMIEYVD
jgi:biotin carboxyl carrier protein